MGFCSRLCLVTPKLCRLSILLGDKYIYKVIILLQHNITCYYHPYHQTGRPADGEGKSIAVISNAQKFIVLIPVLEDGEPLVYPKDQTKDEQAILDYEGKPIGESGLFSLIMRTNLYSLRRAIDWVW